MKNKKSWKKNLYENQDYPDNYTDRETFLKDLRVNVNFKPLSFYECASGATTLVQELCTVVAFLIFYVYLYNQWIDPSYLFYLTSAATALGFLVYRVFFNSGIKNILGQDLRTVLIFIVFGQLFSPVLHTLTDTVSTDTIHTMTFLMMLIHLVFYGYGVPADVVSNSLSLSAAIFASICLSSRLASRHEAFILMTISIKCFVLLPLLRYKFKNHMLVTLLFIIFTIYILLSVSFFLTWLFILAIIFLNIICPILFIKYQKYKDNIYGPWDEAIVHDTD